MEEFARQLAHENKTAWVMVTSRWRWKHLVDVRKKIAAELKKKGASNAQIGRLLNRHYSTVSHYLENK